MVSARNHYVKWSSVCVCMYIELFVYVCFKILCVFLFWYWADSAGGQFFQIYTHTPIYMGPPR